MQPRTPDLSGIWLPLVTPFRDGELDETPRPETPKPETTEQATTKPGGMPSRASLRSTDDVASRPADQLVRAPRRRGRPARAANPVPPAAARRRRS